ncbi:Eukaryotic translation initiation factor 5A [Mycena venus]|uniref:Eukaryotic translation initiation factor 5A n=1 Tax=Mycena venus TaxID=2733690 RepID=A0A8H6WT88_9AGAR|nr:Eukaryotic translation initiation factor 5A [Mycena venus]
MKSHNIGFETDNLSYEELERAGPPMCKPQANILRRPVRIIDIYLSTISTRKMVVRGVDVFTDKKLEQILYLKDPVVALVVSHAEYTLINIDAPILNLLTDDGEPKDDVNVPDGSLGTRLAADFALGKELRVRTVAMMGEERVVSYKEAAD